jgi:hypothetical protein
MPETATPLTGAGSVWISGEKAPPVGFCNEWRLALLFVCSSFIQPIAVKRAAKQRENANFLAQQT